MSEDISLAGTTAIFSSSVYLSALTSAFLGSN
jgi:hypothetical protein